MAMLESITAKTLSENFLQRVVSVIVGVCSTVWVCSVVGFGVSEPLAIATHIGKYLGVARAAEVLAPIAAWCDQPHRLPLFLGAAFIAGALFSLNAAPVVSFYNSATQWGWVLFLPAVQGAGVLASTGIGLGMMVTAFTACWLRVRSNDVGRRTVWHTWWFNLAGLAWHTFHPLSMLLFWYWFASYSGEVPHAESRQDTQPSGARTVTLRPVRTDNE